MPSFLCRSETVSLGLLVAAAVVAAAGALPYADSANDGSRLAAVESLVDRHTLAIDESVFVKPPKHAEPGDVPRRLRPYAVNVSDGYHPNDWILWEHGTTDKLRIDGHFYSDKPPVPAFLMAGLYWLLQTLFGLRVGERTDLFCYWMTLASSGLAYVVAVVSIHRMGCSLRLSTRLALGLAVSFALATVALPYSRHVNGHIVLLGAAAAAFALLADLARGEVSFRNGKLVALGMLAGFGYATEQATGGLLLGGLGLVVLIRQRSLTAACLFALGALPWVAAHHAVSYAVAGTFRPANQTAAYFDYPGSHFDRSNLTGFWNHDGAGSFLYYAAALLFGQQGFWQLNVPLWLLLPAGGVVLWRVRAEHVEAWFAFLWCVATWMTYAALSMNYSGCCCSVRWFVPLLAGAYFLLALLLRDYPSARGDFWLLSAWGVVAAGLMWHAGPWRPFPIERWESLPELLESRAGQYPALQLMALWIWEALAAAALTWAAYRAWRGVRFLMGRLTLVRPAP